jgi:hypothetical protein
MKALPESVRTALDQALTLVPPSARGLVGAHLEALISAILLEAARAAARPHHEP